MKPLSPSPPFQPPTAGTIVAISIMNVVLLVGNHILYGAAPSPHIQALGYECFGFITVLPSKKIHSLPLAFPLSFSSSQARLLTPTPFLSAPFKSKQKTHLVCLLPPFSPLSLSFSLTPSLFLLGVFFNCFYQHKSSTLLVGRAGWRSFVRGSTTRLKTVAGVQLAVKDDHCIPQPHVYKLLTDCVLICLCRVFKAVYVSVISKLQQRFPNLSLWCTRTACQVKYHSYCLFEWNLNWVLF